MWHRSSPHGRSPGQVWIPAFVSRQVTRAFPPKDRFRVAQSLSTRKLIDWVEGREFHPSSARRSMASSTTSTTLQRQSSSDWRSEEAMRGECDWGWRPHHSQSVRSRALSRIARRFYIPSYFVKSFLNQLFISVMNCLNFERTYGDKGDENAKKRKVGSD